MEKQHLGVSPEDQDPDPEETLARHNSYIVALVGQMARQSSNLAHPAVFDLEVAEIVQRVRIKFWKALAVNHIEHHRAYIRRIVQNEFNDLSRKRKAPLPLIFDDEGELYMGDTRVVESVGMADPADEFEESERLEELMDSALAAVAKLSPRQQRAMICELHEKIDASLQLIQAMRKYQIEMETLDWPADEADKKLLKASLSPARHKLAESLSFDIDAHKNKK